MTPVVPFENAIPDRIIWVSPDGNDSNSGAHDAPLRSIQLAMDRATPGTAILLLPGEYTGNLEFKNVQGTEESPIWLAAADGRGTVTITAASNSSPVISFFGEDNLVIQDLTLVGGSNGLQASQSGSDYTDLVRNVVIRGNTILDSALDGIKISQGVNIHVIENTVSNVGEEGVDFVAVVQSQISGNEISNVTGSSAGLFAKGGSSDILISNNYVHDIVADGILVGGWASSLLPGTDYEAKNVEVVGNVVEETGRRPVAILGGQEVDIHDNFFASTVENDYLVYVGAGGPQLSPPPPSSDVTVHDNVFDRATSFARVESGSTDIVFLDNVKDGVIEGDMRVSPPDPTPSPITEAWPEALLDAPVLWQTSAHPSRTIKGTSGADTLTGNSSHDLILGGGNIDTMTGRGGDDTYEVSTSKDVIIENAGEGIDTVRAFSGYTLAANVENLVVKASGGGTFAGNELNNIMTAGSGNDVLSGKGGDDLFVLSSNASQDRIADFLAGPTSRDTIDLRAFTEFSDLADVLASSAQIGADTKISFASGGSVTLSMVTATSLTADDFLFGAAQPDANTAPTDVVLSNGEIVEGAPAGTIVGALAAIDADSGDTFTYTLIDDAAGRFAIDGANLVVAGTLDHETGDSHSVTVRVTDSAGNTFDKTIAIAVADAPPTEPVDTAAEANEIVEGAATGALVGIAAAASDPAGGAVSYSLLDDAGGRFSIDPLTGVVSVANGDLLDHESATEHTIVVQASDPSGAASTKSFTIAVGNTAPSTPVDVDGAPDTVGEGAADGTAVGVAALSADAGGGSVFYSLLDDAGGRFAIDPITGAVSVANGSLLDYETATEHSIVVQVSDPSGAASTQSFTIAVGNLAPSVPADASAEPDFVAENAADGTEVGIVASAVDPVGGAVTYSLLDDAGGRFAIDPSTGTVTVANGALLDYETAAEHTIVAQASDPSGVASTQSFTIAVGNAAPSNPVDVDADQNVVSEKAANGTAVGIAALSADAGGGPVSYALLDDAGGRFAIDPLTGVVTVANGDLLDYESATEHSIVVQASDPSGAASSETFTIAIDNLAPSVPADLSAQSNLVAEGAANGTEVGIIAAVADPAGGHITYALLDDAGGRFAIDPMTGVVSVANGDLLDYESATEHSIVVQASDPSGAASTESFTIAVSNLAPSAPVDASEAPDFVAEGAADGTVAGITVAAADPAGGPVTYSLLDDASGRFAIDPTTGVVTVVNGALLDCETASEHTIVVRASDPSGASSAVAMTIAIADVAPSSPVDAMAEADAVAEGAADGTAVGVVASSADPSGGSVIYSLLDDAGGRFAIDPSTGAVTVAAGDLLDYESAQSHTIVIAATTGGLSATSTFTIAVTNVDPATIDGTDGADLVDATHAPLGQPLPTSEADKIYGYGGNDQLSGLAGNDLIDGGLGADLMYGGSGNDTYVVASAGDITIEDIDGGTDTVLSSTSYTLAANVENLTLTGTASTGTGNALDNVILGNGGNNLLAGLEGADWLDGGASGTDTADYSASDAGVCVSLVLGRGFGGHAQGDRLVSIENITGSDYNDKLEGGAGTNILRGGDGNDTVTYEHAKHAVTVTLATTEVQNTDGAGQDRLFSLENLTGSEFSDQLTGSNGANVLRGLGGDDRINGGGGNDTLDGGIGADILTGGAGNDCFVFGDLTGGVDTVADFVSQSDMLKIVSANFGGSLAAGAAAILFTTDDVANAIGSDDGSYFIFDNAGEAAGTLYFDATGGTGEDATAFALLLDTASLASSDFLIV